MRTDIDPTIIAAALDNIRCPILQVHLFEPGSVNNSFDLSPYIQKFDLTLPPNNKASIVQIVTANPNGIISLSPLFTADYEVNVRLGYLTPYGPRLAQIGRFWLDTPQRQLTANPPQDTITFQARDAVKIWLERAFTDAETFSLLADGVTTLRQAIQTTASYVTVAGQTLGITFDEDNTTKAILDAPLAASRLAGPQASSKTAAALLTDLLSTSRLLAYPRWDGTMRIGLMNQQSPVAAVFGGPLAIRRPVFVRDLKKMSLNTKNWVHVYGTGVVADASDTRNIANVGRVKWAMINDPAILTQAAAETRAAQELNLQSRLSEQPDILCPWLPDIERRDLIEIDDEAAMGIPRGVWRVEDMHFTYTSGTAPDASMQLGMGKAYADELTLDSATLYESGGTSITGDA